jgi:hypothetical protein
MNSFFTLILAIIAVESGGDNHAIGDNGKAYGCLQIWSAYVEDANQFAGTSYTHADAFDRKKSIAMFTAYMSRYATEKRIGHTPTAEDIARIHNGGPNGYRKVATDVYWAKVKAELYRMGAHDLADGKLGFDL